MAAFADILEQDRNPLAKGEGAYLEPLFEGRVELLEGDLDRFPGGALKLPGKGGFQGLGKGVPEGMAEELFAQPAEEALSLGVDVGEAPVGIDDDDAIADTLEDGYGQVASYVGDGRI